MRGYNFRIQNHPEAVDIFMKMIEENSNQFATSVVVFVSHCDDSSVIESSEVHVFHDFIDAASTINLYEYSSNDVVDVYATKEGFIGTSVVHVKCKVFGDLCYSCLAGCSPDTWNNAMTASRILYDKNAIVYVHEHGEG